MIATFIGHRTIKNPALLKQEVADLILYLVKECDVDTFMFGSKSKFNDICFECATDIKRMFNSVKLVYYRAEYPVINDDYNDFLLSIYDETQFPSQLKSAGKSVYVQRNRLLIDSADICVFYCDLNYIPKSKRKSGTISAYNYAISKHKKIINLFK